MVPEDDTQNPDRGLVIVSLLNKVMRNIPDLMHMSRWRTLVEKTISLASIAAFPHLKKLHPMWIADMGDGILASPLTRDRVEAKEHDVNGGLIRFPAEVNFGIQVDWNHRMDLATHADLLKPQMEERGYKLAALMDGPTFITRGKDHLMLEDHPIGELLPEPDENNDFGETFAQIPNNGLMINERELVPLLDRRDRNDNDVKSWIYASPAGLQIMDKQEQIAVSKNLRTGRAEGILLGCAGMLESSSTPDELQIIKNRISEAFNTFSAFVQVFEDPSQQKILCSYYVSMHDVDLNNFYDYVSKVAQQESSECYFRAALLEMYDHAAYVVNNNPGNGRNAGEWIGINDPDNAHALNVMLVAGIRK